MINKKINYIKITVTTVTSVTTSPVNLTIAYVNIKIRYD